jgi:hypothetical protein
VEERERGEEKGVRVTLMTCLSPIRRRRRRRRRI